MGVDRTEVRITGNDAAFRTTSAKVKAELAALRSQAQQTSRSIADARRAAGPMRGKASLFSRLGFEAKRSGVEFGPIELGTQGFGLNRSILRGVGGRAIVAFGGIHAVGGLLNAGADFRDRIRAGQQANKSGGEIAREIGGDVAGGVTKTVASLTGLESLTRGILRGAGMTEKGADKTIADFYDKIFRTREELERRRQAAEDAKRQIRAEADKRYQQSLGALETYTPTTFEFRRSKDLAYYRKLLVEKNRPRAAIERDSEISLGELKRKNGSEGH